MLVEPITKKIVDLIFMRHDQPFEIFYKETFFFLYLVIRVMHELSSENIKSAFSQTLSGTAIAHIKNKTQHRMLL